LESADAKNMREYRTGLREIQVTLKIGPAIASQHCGAKGRVMIAEPFSIPFTGETCGNHNTLFQQSPDGYTDCEEKGHK
jgi:hypothetical protein